MEGEIPFEIPESWEWVHLIDVCEYIQRGKSPKYSPIKKYPVIAQKCNQWSGFSIDKAQFIEPASIDSYGPERILQDRDLLWNSTGLGTLGRMAIFRTELNPYELAVTDSHVTVIRPLKELVLPEYLYYYFASPCVQNVIEDKADGSTKQKELATATIKAYFVPLPPLQEQERILRKVAEVLPALSEYDLVEQRNSRLNAEFPDRLKKSILQEAVQGKLVPQDPADEPASILLERIRAEKEQLIKAGKIKRDKHESIIFRRDNSHYEKLDGIERCIDDEILFDIPDSWAWVRFAQIATFENGDRSSKYPVETDYVQDGIPFFGAKDMADRFMSFEEVRFISKEKFAQLGNGKLEDGDMVCLLRGNVGKTRIFRSNSKYSTGFICAQMLIIRCLDSRILDYVHSVISSPFFIQCVEAKITGTAVRQLPAKEVAKMLIPVPPLAEQQRIVTALQNSFDVVNKI